mgnify:CR=1 FL=1
MFSVESLHGFLLDTSYLPLHPFPMPPVIRVENLSKKYRLGVINRQMLVDQIESWVARKLGRPDPNAKVFEHTTKRMPASYDLWALKDVSSGKSTLLKILFRTPAFSPPNFVLCFPMDCFKFHKI